MVVVSHPRTLKHTRLHPFFQGKSIPASALYDNGCYVEWPKVQGPTGAEMLPTVHTHSETGSMTNEIMLQWLHECVIPCLPADRSANKRALLLMDGLQAHHNKLFVEECANHFIEIILRYPHSTRDTQGEDRVNFAIFKPRYRLHIDAELAKFGLAKIAAGAGSRTTSFSRAGIARATCAAFTEAFSTARNLQAWEQTGFSPFNRKVMWEIKEEADRKVALLQSLPERPPQSTLDFFTARALLDMDSPVPLSGLTESELIAGLRGKQVRSFTLYLLGPLTTGKARAAIEASFEKKRKDADAKTARAVGAKATKIERDAHTAREWVRLCALATGDMRWTKPVCKTLILGLNGTVNSTWKVAKLTEEAQRLLAAANMLTDGQLNATATAHAAVLKAASVLVAPASAATAPQSVEDAEDDDDDDFAADVDADGVDDDGDADSRDDAGLSVAVAVAHGPPSAAAVPVTVPPEVTLQARKRLQPLMSSPSPVVKRDDRTSLVVWIAHTVLWRTSALEVYGGFVRDHIVRGEQASDVDVLVRPDELNLVEAAIKSAASRCGVVVIDAHAKGSAWCMRLSAPGIPAIEVDLVRAPATSGNAPAATVDASAGNLAIGPRGQLRLKVRKSKERHQFSNCAIIS